MARRMVTRDKQMFKFHDVVYTMNVSPASDNPHISGQNMHHYHCHLVANHPDNEIRSTDIIFSKGLGHKGVEPSIQEVLQCIAADACTYEQCIDYDGFLDEFGYEDEEAHRSTWRAIERQSEDLNFNLLPEDIDCFDMANELSDME